MNYKPETKEELTALSTKVGYELPGLDTFDTWNIELVRDTDWHTNYDISLYKDGMLILSKPFSYNKTCDRRKKSNNKDRDKRYFKFGKYRGELMRNIVKTDPSYIDWCYKNIKNFTVY